MARIPNAGLLRQGDVLLVPVDEFPRSRGLVDVRPGGEELTLAEGEATGHAHRIVGSGARVATWRSRTSFGISPHLHTFLLVEGDPVTLTHEEHAPISVATGIYEVRRQREYRPHLARWVAD